MFPSSHTDEITTGGIYVHIPFCVRKCPYCDFYSITDLSLLPDFIAALDREIRLTAAENDFPCDTLYFGGGTPSLIHPETVERLITVIRRFHPLPPAAEITLEVNPGTVDLKRLKAYQQAGINRLSIGVQSFQDSRLAFLGRIHTAAEADEVLRSARAAGFDNVSLDLIYGLPGQSAFDWEKDLEQAAAYAPEHLSCYMLSYETGAPLTQKLCQDLFTALPDDAVALLFRRTVSFLASSGYELYEVSNFAAKPCYRSRHNQKYWSFAPYLGLGPSAHSHQEGRRRWNHRSLSQYLSSLSSGRLPVEAEEMLTPEQQMMEAVYLGLRQQQGIDLAWFETKFQINFQDTFAETIHALHQEGFLHLTGRHCGLTIAGMLLLDGIVQLFVDAMENI